MIGQLEKDLQEAREVARYAEVQGEAGHQTPFRKIGECNQLKAEKDQQKSMEKIFRVLWTNKPLPRDMTELAKRLKGARRGFRHVRWQPAKKVLEKHVPWLRHIIVY